MEIEFGGEIISDSLSGKIPVASGCVNKTFDRVSTFAVWVREVFDDMARAYFGASSHKTKVTLRLVDWPYPRQLNVQNLYAVRIRKSGLSSERSEIHDS